MMRYFRFILALALVPVVVASCGKEAEHQQDGWKPGGKIVFSAESANQPVTKTAYESGTANGYIYWQEGDKVEISCVTSEGTEKASYSASPASGDATELVLAPLGDGSLVWGSGTHTFYSLYPSPQMDGVDGFSLDGANVTLTMPATQAPSSTSSVTESGITTTTMAPNMLYAPLIACTQITDLAQLGSTVPLRYKAAFTAFEFIVKVANADGELRLTDFTFGSGSTDLAVASASATITGEGSDVCLTPVANTLSQASHTITVPLGTQEQPFILSGGNVLVFTVLTLAFEDIGQVTLRFNTTTGYRSLALKYDATYFAQYKDALIAAGSADANGWRIFPKGKKITMGNFQVPGHMYISFSDITISLPYLQQEISADWGFTFMGSLDPTESIIGGQGVTDIVAGGSTWSDLIYDIFLETAVINGQQVSTQNSDSPWTPILEPLSNMGVNTGGQPYEPFFPDFN